MQSPQALLMRPAGNAQVAHDSEHVRKKRDDVKAHQRSVGQLLSMRRADSSTARMWALTTGTRTSSGRPLASRRGPGSPPGWGARGTTPRTIGQTACRARVWQEVGTLGVAG